MTLLNARNRRAGEATGGYLGSSTEIPLPSRQGCDEPDVSDLWLYFETYRHSAAYYLNLYFEAMDRIAITSSSWDTGGNPPNSPDGMCAKQTQSLRSGIVSDACVNHVALARSSSSSRAEEQERETMRLKIYTDALMRDLIAMEDALTRAQTIHNSTKPVILSLIPTVW